MTDLHSMTRGRWILASDAEPAASGEYRALVRGDDGGLAETTREYDREYAGWLRPDYKGADPGVAAWWLWDAGGVERLAEIIKRAESVLDRATEDLPNLLENEPAMSLLVKIREANSILGGA